MTSTAVLMHDIYCTEIHLIFQESCVVKMQKVKHRARWWSYILRVVREYPEMEAELKSMQTQRITQKFDGNAGGKSGHGDPVFQAVSRTLPRQDMRELQAVRDAITVTKEQNNGEAVMRLVDLVYWKQCSTITGAASKVGYSRAYSHRLLIQFMYKVAYNLELTDNLYLAGVGRIKGGVRYGTEEVSRLASAGKPDTASGMG